MLFCIALQQLRILNRTKITFFSSSSSIEQQDFISINEKKLTSVKYLLPPNSTIGYIQDKGMLLSQGTVLISQYAMAPHLLQEKPLPDTVLANFPISGTLQHHDNPLYAERNDWIVLKDFKNGFLLIKRK
ncbi:hypothetical protein [Hymenobacter sp. PAMC 26628]|uniref:hypothetical protein n=1 Tax=Hymenobacter sp. PAMC 26628 TaxID=1484118 RepID=UPI0012FF8921|nr:hypothetical protein [Hymenobacter sp. PAMC 26628]